MSLVVHEKNKSMKILKIDHVYDLNSPEMADVKMARVKMSEKELKSIIKNFKPSDLSKDQRPELMVVAEILRKADFLIVDAKTGSPITTAEEAKGYYCMISGEDKYIGLLDYVEKHPDAKLSPFRVTLVEYSDVEECKRHYFLHNVKNPMKLPPKIKNRYLESVKSPSVKQFLIYSAAGYGVKGAMSLCFDWDIEEDEIQSQLAGLNDEEVDAKFTETTYMNNMTKIHSECLGTFSNGGKISSILKGNILWGWISKKLKAATSQGDEADKLAEFFKKMLSSDAKSIEFPKEDKTKKKSEIIHEKLDELYGNLK